MLNTWLATCEVHDEHGRPVHLTPHQWRHTFACRLINRDVPQEVVRVLLDHESHEMTAHYARITDQTVRRRWEAATKVNIKGERVTLDPQGPLAQAQWAKTRYGIATQTLPNGYCGLPLQRSCPHANACLTCPVFLTGPEFLPELREQRRRTLALIDVSNRQRTDPDGRDEPAGTHQPRTHDRRDRKQRPGQVPPMPRADNSHFVIAAARRRAAATHKRAVVGTATYGQSRPTNHFRRGSPRSRGLPILALQPAGPTHRNRTPPSPATPSDTARARSRTGNAPPTPPCCSGCRPLPSASSIWRPKTDSSARRSPTRSVSSAPTPFTAIAATRRQQNLPPSSAPADHASKTPSSTHNRWSEPCTCHQLQITSGRFAANCAWLACAVIAHNLLRAAGMLAGDQHAGARGATLRRIITVPARAAPARKPTLHLPAHWPWQIGWKTLWDNIIGYSPAIPRAG